MRSKSERIMKRFSTKINQNKRFFASVLAVLFLAGWFSFAYYLFSNQILIIPIVGEVVGFEATTIALTQGKLDANVKAIILYFDTPGGSAYACMEIAKYVQDVAKTTKPVIAVLGPVCASGGYYIASFANYILTHSNTITGSIGVIAVWVDMSGYYAQQGINITVWTTGSEKDMGADWRPPTTQEREMINSTVYSIYHTLLTDIQQNRNLSQEVLEIIKTGGTFSGSDAVELNLADAIGDIPSALVEAIRMKRLWKFIIVSSDMDDKHRFLTALF